VNLLKDIEGYSGEALTTAVLRHLVLRSNEVKTVLVREISKRSPVGPVFLESHFSCYLEQYTVDESKVQGRIDLVLETDDAVVGIENKLLAGFQAGQPFKYLDTLRERAHSLGSIRRREIRHFCVVLAPADRREEIEGHLAGARDNCAFLSWDDLLSALSKQVISDPGTTAIIDWLSSYINDHSVLSPKFHEWLPHLRRRFPPRGDAIQHEFVRRVWQFFPEAGPRLGAGPTWVGYYFASSEGWYGFVSTPSDSSGKDTAADFVIQTRFDIPFSKDFFERVPEDEARVLVGSWPYTWRALLDARWANPETWRNALAPIHAAISEAG
ncbi:MAG: PD-(D/E)XK nuclease family protein, partial [Chloroflexi bacterium]|nr:PD-(D/E)XK nuclease family protein [Chloroflexota bacterium]